MRRRALPLVSAVAIAVCSMVALPNAAMASFGDHSHARGGLGIVAGNVELLACGGPPPIGVPRPCVFRPVAGVQIELNAGGRTTTRTITDVNGRYSARVKAGAYIVRVAQPLELALLGTPQSVQVHPRQLVEADFRLIFQAL